MTLQTIKTREFGTLVDVFESLHESGDVILVDSLTHFSNNVKESFLASRNRKTIDLRDWSQINDTFALFTRPLVNSKLHVVVCGRLAFDYEAVPLENGKIEFQKSDTKLKALDQVGHEPALLVHLAQLDNAGLKEQLRTAAGEKERNTIKAAMSKTSSIEFVATVDKDRTYQLQGRQFVFKTTGDPVADALPVEEAFRPFVDWHLKNTSHGGVIQNGSTEALLAPSGREFQWQEDKRRRDIAMEELEAQILRFIPGAAGKDKVARGDVLDAVFHTRSLTKIGACGLEVLEPAVAKTAGSESTVEQVCRHVLSPAYIDVAIPGA